MNISKNKIITYNIHIYHVGLTDYRDFMFE